MNVMERSAIDLTLISEIHFRTYMRWSKFKGRNMGNPKQYSIIIIIDRIQSTTTSTPDKTNAMKLIEKDSDEVGGKFYFEIFHL